MIMPTLAANALPTLGQQMQPQQAVQNVEQQPQSSALLQAQLMQQQRQRKMADALMKQGYIPNSGGLGALAMIASAYKGKKINKEADEKIADYTKRLLEAQTAEEQAKAQRALDAEIEKEKRKAAIDRETKLYEFGLSESKTPEQIKELRALQKDPSLASMDFGRRRAGASTTNITVPGENYAKPFDEALAKSDVAMLDESRKAAMDAQRIQQSANQLKSVLDKIPAGKPQEFYGKMSQYFGGKAGADYQAQKALVEDQVNQILSAAKGPQTDQDAERARAQIPNMGTDPRAREIIFNYIRSKSNQRIKEFRSMDAYARERGNLQGYEMPLDQPAEAVDTYTIEMVRGPDGKLVERKVKK